MPTSNSPEDIFKRLQKLASDAATQQQQVIEQYGKVAQRFLERGNATDLNPAKMAEFWTNEVSRYVQGVTEANLNYYTAIVTLGRGFLDNLADEALKPAPAKSPAPAVSKASAVSTRGTPRRPVARTTAAKKTTAKERKR